MNHVRQSSDGHHDSSATQNWVSDKTSEQWSKPSYFPNYPCCWKIRDLYFVAYEIIPKKWLDSIVIPHPPKKKILYFEWSPPWHVGWRLSGEGCRRTILFCHFVQIISCGPFSWRAPGKQPRSKVIATATAHVQTCQNMSGYDLTNISKKQKSNMSVDLLKQDQKLLRQQRCMLKHAKTCQDTTCQTYQRNRNQTCQ